MVQAVRSKSVVLLLFIRYCLLLSFIDCEGSVFWSLFWFAVLSLRNHLDGEEGTG